MSCTFPLFSGQVNSFATNPGLQNLHSPQFGRGGKYRVTINQHEIGPLPFYQTPETAIGKPGIGGILRESF